jgi:nitrate reductase NapAB chaperone NapD
MYGRANRRSSMTKSSWSVSGLCVTTRPEDLAAVERILNDRPGVEVHGSDPRTGRLVAVQECATVEDHQSGLRGIQSLPGVLTADLVVHYQEDPDGPDQRPITGGA